MPQKGAFAAAFALSPHKLQLELLVDRHLQRAEPTRGADRRIYGYYSTSMLDILLYFNYLDYYFGSIFSRRMCYSKIPGHALHEKANVLFVSLVGGQEERALFILVMNPG